MKVCINGQGHMSKMATMAINSKNRTRSNMILILDMKHQGMKLNKVCINHDPRMTLTYFTARST